MPVQANVLSLPQIYGAAEEVKGARRRNALLDSQLQQQQQQNALLQNPDTTPEQFIRGGMAGTGNALQQNDSARQQAYMDLAGVAQRILDLPADQHRAATEHAQRVFAQQFQATGVKGGDLASVSDQQLTQALQQMASLAPRAQGESYTLSPGQTRFENGKQVASVAPTPEKPKPKFRTLTPDEVKAAGLPPGTSAQMGEDGKIDVLSKRDNSGGLNQKDQTTAKLKLNTVKLARAQLKRIKDAFTEGRQGVNAFGPGQGLLPTQAGKKFDARVNQMRSTLTALTRVPGVGAMSDYETKLDQAKFPERNAWESVTEDVVAGLDDQLSLIETGYRDLLSGTDISPPAPEQPAQAGPVRVNTPQEAMALPSGTQFQTPDGRIKVRP
jgi:hypothetical protein